MVWRFWTLACVGSGDHAGRLIQFLFSTELCPWITFGGQVSGHHCRSEGNKAGACVSGGCRTSSASRLEVLDDSAGELELARSRSRRRRPWASKYRDVHSLCACDHRRRPCAAVLLLACPGSPWRECPSLERPSEPVKFTVPEFSQVTYALPKASWSRTLTRTLTSCW